MVSGNQSESDYQNCKSSLDSTISAIQLKTGKNLSNDDLFNLISSYAFKARIEIHNRNYLKATKYLKLVIDHLKLSLKYINADEKFKLTSGLYYYFMEYSIKKYPFMFPYLMFFPKGNKEKGLELITYCSSSKNAVIWTEANYFLMKINLYTEKKFTEAEKFAKRLINKYPNNLVYNFEYFNILLELKQNDRVSAQFDNINQISTNNDQLNNIQKQHFINLAKEKLKE
jgi:tetratricopeptide (TPR) repeat protein